jgi:hypothetical protein
MLKRMDGDTGIPRLILGTNVSPRYRPRTDGTSSTAGNVWTCWTSKTGCAQSRSPLLLLVPYGAVTSLMRVFQLASAVLELPQRKAEFL